MKNNGHDDKFGIAAPMVQLSLAFIVGDDVGDICRHGLLVLRPDRYLIQRIPSGRGTVRAGRLELDTHLAHPFPVTCRHSPVLALDIIHDTGCAPAPEERRDDQTYTFTGPGRRNDGQMLIGVIPQIRMAHTHVDTIQLFMQLYPGQYRKPVHLRFVVFNPVHFFLDGFHLTTNSFFYVRVAFKLLPVFQVVIFPVKDFPFFLGNPLISLLGIGNLLFLEMVQLCYKPPVHTLKKRIVQTDQHTMLIRKKIHTDHITLLRPFRRTIVIGQIAFIAKSQFDQYRNK